MIVKANVAVNNVTNYNNELSRLVHKICDEIEKAASKGKYSTYVTMDLRLYMINNIAAFLQNELGYRVIVKNGNTIDIFWGEEAISPIKHDSYLAAEAIYLTAMAAYNIASDVNKSYDNVCEKISKGIVSCSKRGENCCNYIIGNLCSAMIEEIEKDLVEAGYDVKLEDDRFVIKWG